MRALKRSVLEKRSVLFDEFFLVLGDIVEGMDGIGGTNRDTGSTVDAAFGIHEHLGGSFELGLVLLGVNAIGGADVNAKGVFDAGISNYVGHDAIDLQNEMCRSNMSLEATMGDQR